IGEHEFVAQSLLPDHQKALAVERLVLPHGRLRHVMHISAETSIVADFVVPPAFFQSSHSDQADAAGVLAFALVGFVNSALKRLVVGLESFFEPPQMLKSIAEIVVRARKAGIEPYCFLIEDEAFFGTPDFG